MDFSQLKFDANGLIPAIAQDAHTNQVLMLAYMNQQSIEQTLETGYATYFSRSRQALWKKGETSGHTQKLVAMRYDCDHDAMLLTVTENGFGKRTAFGEYRVQRRGGKGLIANELRSPMQVAPQALQQQIAATLAQLQPAEAIIG